MAQVAITALTLEGVRKAFFVAAVCFLESLSTGVLSVFFACKASRMLGSLRDIEAFREWISCPPDLYSEVADASDVLGAAMDAAAHEEGGGRGRRGDGFAAGGRQSSLVAAAILANPPALLNISLGSFLVGVALWLGFAHKYSLFPYFSSGDTLGLLLAFLLSTFIGTFYFFVLYHLKEREMAPYHFRAKAAYLQGTQRTDPELFARACGMRRGYVRRILHMLISPIRTLCWLRHIEASAEM